MLRTSIPNATYKTANMNYSFSILVKCVAALHFCYLLSLFNNEHYSKSILPNTCMLLFCYYIRWVSVAYRQQLLCHSAYTSWCTMILFCCKFAINLDIQSSHDRVSDEWTYCNARYGTATAYRAYSNCRADMHLTNSEN